MSYNHGPRVTEKSSGTRPIRTVSTKVIGVIVTGDDADAATFPENTLVQLIGPSRYADKFGTTGTLKKTMDAIIDQCEPTVYVCRVPEGNTEAETITNVIGGMVNGKKTGLQSLLSGKQIFGAKSRIIGAPFLDETAAVKNELVVIAEKLKAFAYAPASGDSIVDAVADRANYGSKRLMLVWPSFVAFDTVSGKQEEISASARALGMRAKIDEEIGFHKTISNIVVQGVEGLSKDVYWDALEPTNEANYLNENEVTTVINEDGFRFWGDRTCSGDPLFAFENYTRTGDAIADTMVMAHLWATSQPMSVVLFKDVLDGINGKLKEMTREGKLLGGEAWFDTAFNPVEALKAGKSTIHYNYTPVPPNEDMELVQIITDEFILDLTSAVASL